MKKLITLLLLLAMTASLMACGGSNAASEETTGAATEDASATGSDAAAENTSAESSQSESSGELTTVRYGAPSTATSSAVWYAYQQGYFEEQGIDIEWIYFNSAVSINEAALANEIDMYSLGATKSVNGAVNFGAKMVGYMVPDNSTYRIYTRADSAIAQAGQGALTDYPEIYGDADAWKNASILATRGQSSHYFINAILTELGLTEEDLTTPIMDIDVNQIPTIFASGEGDVMCVGNPLWTEFADNPDYVMVGSLDMMYPEYDNVCTVMATDAYIASNNDAVQGFVTALIKAQNELSQDNELFAQTMYDWESTYNVDASEDQATLDASFYTQHDYAYLEEHFDGGAGNTVADEVFSGIVDFMLATDQLTQEEYDKYQTMGFVDPTYTMNALAELK